MGPTPRPTRASVVVPPAPNRPAPTPPAPMHWIAEPPGPLVVTPSLRAAADLPLRIGSAIIGLVAPFAIFALLDAAREGEPVELWTVLVAAALTPEILIALGAAFVPAIRLAFTRYIFHEDGITVQTRVLAATEQRVPWAKVTALQHRRTFIDRILGIERLDVVAYGIKGTTVHLVGLRPAAPLRDLISSRMRETASVQSLFAND